MKNLSYFLWVRVFGLAGCVGFDILFHNYLKENDLLSIKQSQRCFEVLQECDKQTRNHYINAAKVHEYSDKDSIILYKAKNIANYDIKDNELPQNTQKIVAWVVAQDTSLQELNGELLSSYLNTTLKPIFHRNYFLSIHFHIDRLTTKAVGRLTAKIGSVGSGFYRSLPIAIAQSKVVEENDEYKASLFYGINYDFWNPVKMYLSDGNMQKDMQGNKYIIISTVKTNKFYSISKITKALTGYVVLHLKWNRDTTLYFSTTYTVKRKK